MPAVNLDGNEWGQVMAILSTAPWRDANPLLMKIGDQLRAAQLRNPVTPNMPGHAIVTDPAPDAPQGNGQEARHESGR